MARILLSVAMDRPWSPGHSLAPALERTGHTIQVFDCASSEDVRADLHRMVDAFQPALHITYGGERYPPDLIRELSRKNVRNVLWYPEVTPSPEPEVVELGKAYDVLFTMAEGQVEENQGTSY